MPLSEMMSPVVYVLVSVPLLLLAQSLFSKHSVRPISVTQCMELTSLFTPATLHPDGWELVLAPVVLHWCLQIRP